ncbi:MAG: hypothetical protein KA524_02825 [Nitrosomonas sp.]|nr:hypothetical protein [Nitrosomonas sp.]MBP6075239.1 hypothetical protein [Nitrosomonas sp.]
MKHYMKQLIMSVCTFLLLGNMHFAAADTASDTEILLNWAENTYPEYFPTHQNTQNIDPWIFRFYPETGIYAGVNKTDNNVYVLGGPWGDTPTVIDTLPNLMTLANAGNSSIPACNTANAPAGLVYTQSGNVVNVTTNGQCIQLPTSNNVCQAPQQTTATGISVLTSNTLISSEFRGFSIDIPNIPNPFQSLADNFSNSKHCTINVPAEGANLIINADVCYDMTAQFSEFENIPGITITPPITMARKDTTTNQSVSDCFATDADTIFDAFTNEFWIKQNGTFVKQ